MDNTRWQTIQELFHKASELPRSEHRTFLQDACGDDEELFAEISAMLEQDRGGHSILDRDLAEIAHRALQSNLDALPFKEFGPYRILRPIGEGGMGVVYLAERKDLGNQVAIKILRDAWLSPARRERFSSEQRTLAQLTHPAIAQLHDADTLPDGTPWFVMEYVDGVPLTEYCHEHNSSIDERLKLFRSVCEAVQYAHGQAVIHRDLKPSNILVKGDDSVRLLDFGIAKQLEALDTTVEQTMTGLRLMTPAYAAPEQVRGDRVGIQTDVYSLGVILYELLAGRLPFDLTNLTPMEAASIVAEEEPGRPSSVAERDGRLLTFGKTAWADLDVLCLTAMHKDPRRRYQSVEALIRDIDHFSNGKPLEARRDSWNYVLGKFVQRNVRAVSAAVVVFALIVSLVVFFTVRLTKARNTALAEAARTQRIQRFTLNLFQGGDEVAGPADNLRVISLLDRGVQEARTLDNEPAVQAELFETLGGIYQKLGKFEQADSLLNSAREERNQIFGPDSAEVAHTLVAIGLLHADEAKLDDAERFVREGLEIDRRKLPRGDPAIARAMTALGRVLEDKGSYDAAIQLLGDAVQLESKQGGATPDLAASLLELANTHFYAGHYEIADNLNHRLLEMHRQLYGDRHALVAEDLINIGAIKQEQARYQEAEQFDREALEIVRSYYGDDHPKTAAVLTLIARSILFQNRFDEAVALLKPALVIRERVYGKVHPSVASTLNELGNVASKQGKYADAERYFQRMIEIYRSIYGDNHYLLSTAQSNLASVYLAEKQYSRAEALFREAVARYIKTLSAQHTSTAIARTKLGRTLLREHRYAEAEVESRAGYEVLSKQMSPGASWLVNARKDLIEEYDALKQPEKAARFRAEIAKLAEKK
jgi:serine/threonine-protein kinase